MRGYESRPVSSLYQLYCGALLASAVLRCSVVALQIAVHRGVDVSMYERSIAEMAPNGRYPLQSV